MRNIIPSIAAAIATIPIAAQADAINLSCQGTSTYTTGADSSGMAFDSSGRTATINGSTAYQTESPDRLAIEITDNGGRIRAPTRIVPPLHATSSNGWWALKSVTVGETEITGSFTFNFLNKPHFSIDRRTGDIVIHALGHSGFEGTCRPVSQDAKDRLF